MASREVTITLDIQRDVLRRIGDYEVVRVRTFYRGKPFTVNYIVQKVETP